MLASLLGNQNCARILTFLYVNGSCYGTQLQRLLHTSLTPLQQALNRLEKGGILTSCYEGKTRLYRFHPAYPLLPELEDLLRKAYSLLSPEEKRAYYVPLRLSPKGQLSKKGASQILYRVWEKMGAISALSFSAKAVSGREGRWSRQGSGVVTMERRGHNTLLFHEKGEWSGREGPQTAFSNTFRWTLDTAAERMALEHLRYGPDRPVFLFYLVPSGKHTLTSVDSHLCGEDAYFGHIDFDSQSLRLHWRILGPTRNEEIDYFYS